MALATSLRATASRMINQFGEACLLLRTTVTNNPSTGTPSTASTTYSFKAAMNRKGAAMDNDETRKTMRVFGGGGRVLDGDEEWLIPAAQLTVQPRPTDVLVQASSDSAAARRVVVDVEVYRAQGLDIAYMVGVKK